MKEKLIALAEELGSGACDIRHDLGPMGYLCGKADGIQEAVEEIDNLVKSAPSEADIRADERERVLKTLSSKKCAICREGNEPTRWQDDHGYPFPDHIWQHSVVRKSGVTVRVWCYAQSVREAFYQMEQAEQA